MQFFRMIAISGLAGVVAAGLVWYAGAAIEALRQRIRARDAARRLSEDQAALLAQARDAEDTADR